MPRSFKKFVSDMPELTEVQRNIEEVLEPIIRANILDGLLIEDVRLTAGQDNAIPHQLTRVPQGWIIVRKNADSRVWENVTDNRIRNANLLLQCSNDVTVSLWVF